MKALTRAALIAGLRTFAQSLAGAFGTLGIAGQVATWGDLAAQLWLLLLALAVAIVIALIAGGGAFLSFLGKGIPEAYTAPDAAGRHRAL